jgi:esterase/lipase
MKILKIVGGFIVLLLMVYAIGPRTKYDPLEFDSKIIIPDISSLEEFLVKQESEISSIKPGCEAKIIWADTSKAKTPYVIVYLHGFSASREEGAPIHQDIAARYGMNLYLPRLEGHGLKDTNSFIDLTPQNYLNSAIEALRIGEQLGDSIVLMSCSTGGTLSILLDDLSPKIAAHIMYSPNIDMYDKASNLLTWPWGKQILNLTLGGMHNRINYIEPAKPFWNEIYHSNGILTLKWIIKNYLTEEYFEKIKKPIFVSYYFKDESHQDNVIDVEQIEAFYSQVGTKPYHKSKYISTTAGAHVITSPIFSKDVENVKLATQKFIEQVLHIEYTPKFK